MIIGVVIPSLPDTISIHVQAATEYSQKCRVPIFKVADKLDGPAGCHNGYGHTPSLLTIKSHSGYDRYWPLVLNLFHHHQSSLSTMEPGGNKPFLVLDQSAKALVDVFLHRLAAAAEAILHTAHD